MWRSITYTLIGNPTRYYIDIRRGNIVSVLPIYTTTGYLPYTGIKKGYYSKEDILDWLIDRLLLLYNEYLRERNIIVLDNVSVYVDPYIIKAIQAKGYLIKYLPLYSPNYNLIEVIFSVLKAWMRRYFKAFRYVFQDDFEGFLRHIIKNSRYDRFAVEHFRYSAAGYIFDGEIEVFKRGLAYKVVVN